MKPARVAKRVLGRGLGGRGGRRVVRGGMNDRFDQTAVDRDGDGVVQEGTRFARRAPQTVNIPKNQNRKPSVSLEEFLALPESRRSTEMMMDIRERALGRNTQQRLNRMKEIQEKFRNSPDAGIRARARAVIIDGIFNWSKAPHPNNYPRTAQGLLDYNADWNNYYSNFINEPAFDDEIKDSMKSVAYRQRSIPRMQMEESLPRAEKDKLEYSRGMGYGMYDPNASPPPRADQNLPTRRRGQERVVGGRVPRSAAPQRQAPTALRQANTNRQNQTTVQQSGTPDQQPSRAQRLKDSMERRSRNNPFNAEREYGDYESKYPLHEVNGMMGPDSADLPKMRDMMKTLIDELEAEGINYSYFSQASDADLQELWSIYNAIPTPERRGQFLAMMVADFELAIRNLARDRKKNGAAPHENAGKVKKIVDNIEKRGFL